MTDHPATYYGLPVAAPIAGATLASYAEAPVCSCGRPLVIQNDHARYGVASPRPTCAGCGFPASECRCEVVDG